MNKKELKSVGVGSVSAKKGITLIALIITIIVMLVLVAVTITMAINGGLFEKAGQAVGDTQDAIDAEQELANGRIKIGGVWYDSIDAYIAGTPSENQGGGRTPYLPNSNFSYVEGTSLANGLVIRDNVGNEYVWIEVPNDGTGPDYSSVGASTDYDNIETALQNYATKYRSLANYDIWYDGKGLSATEIPSSGSGSGSSSSSGSGSGSSSSSGSGTTISSNLEDTSGCGLTYAQYTTLKHKMLTSIYENGGFYIGRYEAGISSPRTEHSDVTTSTTIKALSQANQYPLNYVYCREAQILASKVATDAGLENYTTSLMFGIQWDLVLTYLEKKGTTYEELAGGDGVGSTKWGNCKNNLWTISNTSAKYYTLSTGWTDGAYGTKSSGTTILLSTGADVNFSKMNIYDLAGNVSEYTLERYGNGSDCVCSSRGGSYDGSGSSYPASCRSSSITTSSGRPYRASRLTLLVGLSANSNKLKQQYASSTQNT